MKKVIERLNRVLAILLVAAMVAGSVPEMGLVARATGSSTDEASDGDDGNLDEGGGEDAVDPNAPKEDAVDPNAPKEDAVDPNAPKEDIVADGEASDNGQIVDDGEDDDEIADGGVASLDETDGPSVGDVEEYGIAADVPVTIKENDSTTFAHITKKADPAISGKGGEEVLKFTVAVEAGYKIVSVAADVKGKNSSDVAQTVSLSNAASGAITPTGAGTGNVEYTVDLKTENISDIGDDGTVESITVNITTKPAHFTVSSEVALDSGTAWPTSAATAEITYTKSCVTGEGTAESPYKVATDATGVVANNAITFKVENIAGGYDIKSGGVTYTIGSSTTPKTPTHDAGSGVYTIPEQEGTGEGATNNITGDIKISVKLVKKTYKFKFDVKTGSDVDVKYVKNSEPEATWSDTEAKEMAYGDKITFTVTPKTPASGSKKHIVRYVGTTDPGDSESSETGEINKNTGTGKYTFEIKDQTENGETIKAETNSVIYVKSTAQHDVTIKFGDSTLGTDKIDIYTVENKGTAAAPKYEGTKVAAAVAGSLPSGASAGDFAVVGTEGKETMFVAVPQTGDSGSSYMVTGVTLGETETAKGAKMGTPITAPIELKGSPSKYLDEISIYTVDLTDVKANETNVALTINKQVNPSKGKTISFALASGCELAGDVTATITDGGGSKAVKTGEKYVTTSNNVTFALSGPTGVDTSTYKAYVDGKEVGSSTTPVRVTSGTYTVDLSGKNANEVVNITISASMQGADGDTLMTVVTKPSGLLETKVVYAEKVVRKTDDQFEIKEGAATVTMTVTVEEGFKPEISWTDLSKGQEKKDADASSSESVTVSGKSGTKYTFVFPAKTLAEISDRTINVSAVPGTTKKITVTTVAEEIDDTSFKVKDAADVEVTADGDGKYPIPANQKATIEFKPATGCKITKIKVDGAEVTLPTPDNTGLYTYTIAKMDADKTFEIVSEQVYYIIVKAGADGSGTEVKAGADGSYKIDWFGKYKVVARQGTDDTTAKAMASATISGTKVTDATEKAAVAALNGGKEFVVLTPNEADAGGTFKLDLNFGTEKAPVVKSFTFAVSAKAGNIKIGDGSETIRQTADTVQIYALDGIAEGVDIKNLEVKVKSEKANPTATDTSEAQALVRIASTKTGEGVYFYNKDAEKTSDAAAYGKLQIMTPVLDEAYFGNTSKIKKVKIQIVDSKVPANRSDYVKGSVVLEITKPEIDVPVMEVVGATDATLSVRLKSNAKAPEKGKLWYEIKVDKIGTAASGSSGVYLVEKASDNQTVTVKVDSSDVGSGAECEYGVSARLIQSKDKTAANDIKASGKNNAAETATGETNVYDAVPTGTETSTSRAAKTAFASDYSAVQRTSTKKPFYATKLTLKQERGVTSTTIYTGQADVPIARLDFGSDATFTKVEAEIVSEFYAVDSSDRTKVSVVDKNGNKNTDNYDGVIAAVNEIMSDELVGFKQEGNLLYMTVNSVYDSEYNQPITGKHKIKVTTVQKGAGDGTAGNTGAAVSEVSATMDVTIKRGIEQLEVVPASDKIYKAAKKVASLDVKTIYNGDATGKDRDMQPAAKKVKYELVDNDDTVNMTENTTTAGWAPVKTAVAAFGNNIKINETTGKITVDKNYTVPAAGVSFKVMVTAKEFDGATEQRVISDDVTVGAQPEVIGRLILVRENSTDSTKYDVIAKADGADVTTDDLAGAQLVAMKENTIDRIQYTVEQLETDSLNFDEDDDDFTNPSKLVFTSSNAKAVKLGTNGDVTSEGTEAVAAKNVTLTAKTSDGGNKSKTLKINVVYARPNYVGLLIKQKDGSGVKNEILRKGAKWNGAANDTTHAAETLRNATANTRLEIQVVEGTSAADLGTSLGRLVNFSMTIAGGDVIKKAGADGNAEVIANKPTMTVTLQDKDTKKKQVFTITNPAAATNLYTFGAVTTTTKSIKNIRTIDETIVYKLNAKDSAKYTGGTLYVKVKADEKDSTKQGNTGRYGTFMGALGFTAGEEKIFRVASDGTFGLDLAQAPQLTAGSYKLVLTFGNREDNGDFTVTGKPKDVTLKVAAVKLKKPSYRVDTTLRMSLKDKAAVKLEGNPKNDTTVVFSDLKNVNTTGAANGNDWFTTYFDVINGSDTAVTNFGAAYTIRGIALKDNLTQTQLDFITDMGRANKAAANARTAYVTCTATSVDGEVEEKVVKLTVTFTKNAQTTLVRWSAANAKMLAGDTNTAVSMLAGGKAAEVSHAYVVDTKEGSKVSDVKFDVAPSVDAQKAIVERSWLALTADKGVTAKKTYKVRINFIPADMYLTDTQKTALADKLKDWQEKSDAAEKLAAKTAYEQEVAKYATEVTATVRAEDKTARTAKIAIAADKLKIVMSEDDYGTTNNTDRSYRKDTSYTKLIADARIHAIKVESTNKADLGTGIFKFEDNGNGTITVKVLKDALDAADKAFRAKNKRNENKTLYGTDVTVKVSVSYKNAADTAEDTSVVKDNFTFRLSLPDKSDGMATAEGYSATVEKIRADKATIIANVLAKTAGTWPVSNNGILFGGDVSTGTALQSDWNLTVTTTTPDNKQTNTNEVYEYVKGVIEAFRAEIGKYTVAGSDTKLVMTQITNEGLANETIKMKHVSSGTSDIVMPTSASSAAVPADGALRLRFELHDSSASSTVKTGEMAWIFSIKSMLNDGIEQPYLLEKTVANYISGKSSAYATKANVDYNMIKADALASTSTIKTALDKYPTLKLSVEAPAILKDKGSSGAKFWSAQPFEWLVKYNDTIKDNAEGNVWSGYGDDIQVNKTDVGSDLTSTYDGVDVDEGTKLAPTNSPGYILGVIRISGLGSDAKDLRVPFKFTLSAIDPHGAVDDASKNTVAKKVKTELVKPNLATNRTTKAEIMTRARAAYNNPNVTLSWNELTPAPDQADKTWKMTEATVPGPSGTPSGAGKILCGFKAVDNSMASGAAGKEVTFNVEIPIAALKDAGGAKDLVIAKNLTTTGAEALKGDIKEIVSPMLRKITAEAELPDDAKEKIVAAVKAYILETANDALKGQPYEAEFAKKAAVTPATVGEDEFTFTPYTYKTNGSISYKLALRALKNGKLNGDKDIAAGDRETTLVADTMDLTIASLAKDDTVLQSTAQAKGAIKAALVKNGSSDWTEAATATNVNDLIAASTNILNNTKFKAEVDSGASAMVMTRPTFAADGKIAVTIVLTEKYTANDPENGVTGGTTIRTTSKFVVDLKLNKLAKTEANAKAEATAKAGAVKVSNSDIEGTTELTLKQAKENEIVSAAQTAVAGSGYTVTKTAVEAKKATDYALGKVKVSFSLAKAEGAGADVPAVTTPGFDVTIVIPHTSHTANAALWKDVETAISTDYANMTLPKTSTPAVATVKSAIDTRLTNLKPDIAFVWATALAEEKAADGTTVIGYTGVLKAQNTNGTPLATGDDTHTVKLTKAQ